MGLTAGDLMTGDILVADASWSVGRLADFLTEHSISGAPVVEAHGRLVGVVSLTDIARNAGLGTRKHAHDYYVYGPAYAFGFKPRVEADTALTVREIMTPMVFDVSVDATPKEIAEIMLRGRIHRVFVTESGMVIGVISAFDMLRALV